jgi:ParB/RepB/Spo0J family partition protein
MARKSATAVATPPPTPPADAIEEEPYLPRELQPLMLRTLVSINLGDLTDNPWQPRVALDADRVQELADNIRELGLLQTPMVRDVGDGGYQIAFGHYRVAALRYLGIETVELEVRTLTDAEMALLALSENRKRTDVPPMEQYRAWAKALEIDGMSYGMLATSLGLDVSTVRGHLRLLQLPAFILKHVDSGELSATAAAEFLCLMGSDGHFHGNIAEHVLEQLSLGSPDYRQARVRLEISNFMNRQRVADWRPLFKVGAGGDPTFDVEAFEKDHLPFVHSIPHDDWTEGTWREGTRQPGKVRSVRDRNWTCKTGAWVAAKNKTKSTASAVAEKAGAKSDSKKATASFAKALASDPVFATVNPDNQGPLLRAFTKKGELEEDAAAALGTRAKPELLTKGSGFMAVVDVAGADAAPYNFRANYQGPMRELPSYFDNVKECRETCTIGATLAQFSKDGRFLLVCRNEQHFNEKVAKGKGTITAKLQKRVDEWDAFDAAVIELLQNHNLDVRLIDLMTAAALSRVGRIDPMKPEGLDWRQADELAIWPANSKRILELLGMRLGEYPDGETYVAKMKGLSGEERWELFTRLLAHDSHRKAVHPFALALGDAEEGSPEPAAAAAE